MEREMADGTSQEEAAVPVIIILTPTNFFAIFCAGGERKHKPLRTFSGE
jgi:hypothetical protein